MDAVKASLVVVVEVAVDVAVVAPTEAAVVMVKAAVVVDVAADLVATAVLPPGLRMPAEKTISVPTKAFMRELLLRLWFPGARLSEM